jgi:Ca2+-binding RTX toxin-like protein
VTAAGGDGVVLIGGAGNDLIAVPPAGDTVPTGDAGLSLRVDGGTRGILYGGDGDDTLTDAGAGDLLIGGAGNDLIDASLSTRGTLYGGDGSNTLLGGAGSVTYLFTSSAAGSDVVTPSPAADRNVYDFSAQAAGIALDLGSAAAQPYANGMRSVRFTGAGAAAWVIGTAFADTVVLRGGAGAYVFGGAGNDTLIDLSPAGGNVLLGQDGDDTVAAAGNAGDVLTGDAGNDTLIAAGTARARLLGLAGTDTLRLDLTAPLTLTTGVGPVVLPAAAGSQNLAYGGDDADTLTVNGGDRQLADGGTGNDTLTVTDTATNTYLYGEAGNDTLTAAGGSNAALYGGDGNDTLNATGTAADSFLYGENDNDSFTVGGGSGTRAYGLAGNDTLFATGGMNDNLYGGSGDDDLRSGATTPAFLWGGSGNDLLLSAAAANDQLIGEEGDDTYAVTSAAAAHTLTFDEVRKYSTLDPATDTPRFGTDTLNFSLLGNTPIRIDLSRIDLASVDLTKRQAVAGNLTADLFGTFENVVGTGGNDTVLGNAADNVFVGGGGDDYLDGRDGNDRLDGGDGSNTLIAGTGNDTYVFSSTAAGADSVTDTGTNDLDVLDFSAQPQGVTADLRSTAPQAYGPNARTFRITTADSIEGVIGTPFADVLTGTDAANSLTGGGGADSLYGLGGNDTLDGGAGSDLVDGGTGDDLYLEAPGGADVLADAGGTDLVDFSAATARVTLDLGVTDTPQAVNAAGTVELDGVFENVAGTRYDDVLTGNAAVNRLIGRGGADVLTDVGGNDFLESGFTQVVLLDFDTYTESSEWQYTQPQRDAIQDRLEQIFAAYPVVFTQQATTATALAADTGGRYATLYFNNGSPGGAATEVDFGNLNPGGSANLNPVDLLTGVPGRTPDRTPDNVIQVSATVAAHELGHLMGLRHGDAFGPIGSGVYVGDPGFHPAVYTPGYAGPAAAAETRENVMGSPESVGVSTLAAAGLKADGTPGVLPHFGEREAIKLAFASSGMSVAEPAGGHGTPTAAVPLAMPALTVPNTLAPTDADYGTPVNGVVVKNTFAVAAGAMIGRLSAAGEADVYAFAAAAGQTFTFELLSASLKRYAGDTFDGVLELTDAAGTRLAFNDDDFETTDATLLDVTLPAAGTYYVKVSANGTGTGSYELLGYTFRAQVSTQNHAPEFNPPTLSLTGTEGSTFAYAAHATDPDGDTLAYSLISGPSAATINAATGQITWVPADDGTYSLVVRAADHDLYADLTIVVSVGNVAPTLTAAGAAGAAEGGTYSLTLSGYTDPGTDTPAAVVVTWGDQSTSTLTPTQLVALRAGQAVTVCHVYADGGPGAGTVYLVSFSVTDEDGVFVPAAARTVTVTNVAPTPAIGGAPASSPEGTAITLTASATDPSGPDTTAGFMYTWSVTKNGAVFATGSGANFTFTPDDDGSYAATLTATDRDGGPATATATVAVTDVAPTASVTGATAGTEGTAVALSASATDPSAADTAAGFTFTWTVTRSRDNGLTYQPYTTETGSTFTLNPDDDGLYRVTVASADKDHATGPAATQVVTVAGAAPTPTIGGLPANNTSPEGTAVTLTASATDPSSADQSAGFAFAWSVTKNGTAYATGSGANFSFTPNDNGTYAVTLTATDKDWVAGTTTATVTATDVAPTPAIAGAPATSPEGTAISLTGSATDPGTADVVALAWAVTKNGVAFASGSGAAFTFTPDDNGTYVVTLTATDTDGAAAPTSKTVAVSNVAPAVGLSGPARVDEGSVYTLTVGAVTDPGADTVGTYRVHWGDGSADTVLTAAQLTAAGRQVTHTFADGAAGGTLRAVTVDLTDEDGTFAAAGGTTVTVDNAPPAVTSLTGPTGLTAGQSGTYTLLATDPAAADAASLRYSFAVSLSDLAADYAHAGTANTFAQAFATAGMYTVYARVYDKDGGVSAPATLTVTVTGTQTGPVYLSGGDLVVTGTAGNDTITVTPSGSGVAVSINGVSYGTFAPTGKVKVSAGAGNDVVTVDQGVTLPAELYGEGGNDTLTGGSGNDLLDGGTGNDSLSGGNGNDVLVGGLGFLDVLLGGNGDDTLTDADGVANAFGENGADIITITFAPGWVNANGTSVLQGDLVDGGNGDDRMDVTVNNQAVQLDLYGQNGADTFVLHGTWTLIRVYGGNGADIVIDQGTGTVVLNSASLQTP